MEEKNKIFELYLKELETFNNDLKNVDSLDRFYSYGWDAIYGDGESFYVKEGNYVKAWDLAEDLGRLEELKEILEKIWEILPEFYELHKNQGDSIPQIPDKWF